MGYPADLTDEQWAVIEPIFKLVIGKYGNRSKWSKRELTNETFYVEKTGCQWNMFPNNFPPYNTVWSFFRRARNDGTWYSQSDLKWAEASRQKRNTHIFLD